MLKLVLTAAIALTLASPAAAKPKNKGHDHPHGQQEETVISVRFGAPEERIIRDYFQQNRVPVESLPPGIAKNLARGKPLPPGIEKKYAPDDLRRRLPDYAGYEVVIVDHDVLLIEAASRVIVDILTGAL